MKKNIPSCNNCKFKEKCSEQRKKENIYYCDEGYKKELTLEDLEKKEVGSIVGVGCPDCEGFEKHKKLPNGKWKCLNCNSEI